MNTRQFLPRMLLMACATLAWCGYANASGTATAISTSQVTVPPCFDVAGASTGAGAAVQLWTCTGNASQLWHTEMIGLTTATDSYSQIVRVVNSNSNLCLDLQAASTASGIGVQQAVCNGASTSQQWILLKNPGSERARLKNRYSGLCLMSRSVDRMPGNNGSVLRQYACDFTEVPNPFTQWAASTF